MESSTTLLIRCALPLISQSGKEVIWPVDVLLVPKKSVIMLRYHNSFTVQLIPMWSQASRPMPKLRFSASRLDKIQRPLRMGSSLAMPRSFESTSGNRLYSTALADAPRRYISDLSEAPWQYNYTLAETPWRWSNALSFLYLRSPLPYHPVRGRCGYASSTDRGRPSFLSMPQLRGSLECPGAQKHSQSYVLGPSKAATASSALLPASRHPGGKFMAESLNNDVSLDGFLASSSISLSWLLGQPGLLSATCRHLRSSRSVVARLVIQGLFVPSCSSCLPP